MICTTEGCKANLPTRYNVHSHFCPKWTPADREALTRIYRDNINPKMG